MWSQIPPEDMAAPLGNYVGRDILTPETAKGILYNNETLSD